MAIIDNLVSYYKLDEESGNAIDAHDNNNGAVVGATYGVTGKILTAYDFDALEYVNIGDKAAFENDTFSFSFWVKRGAIGAYHGLVCLQAQAAAAGGPSGIFTRFNSNNTFGFLWCISNGVYGISTTETFTNLIVWNHFVVTKSGTSIKIYHDADEIKSGSTSSPTLDWSTTSAKKTSIGAYWNGQFDWFQTFLTGVIDEVGVWSRLLEPSEVTALFNGGNGLAYPFGVAGVPTIMDYYRRRRV